MGLTTESAEKTEGAEREVQGLNRISGRIIGAAIEVHRVLGPGLLESTYEACLDFELRRQGLPIRRQWPLPVTYKGTEIDRQYRLDLVVAERILLEIKAVEQLLPIHQAQVLSYLRLSGLPLGLLINFHSATLKDGIRRFRNFRSSSAPSDSSVSSVVQPVDKQGE
jgi:GxxExxY protein